MKLFDKEKSGQAITQWLKTTIADRDFFTVPRTVESRLQTAIFIGAYGVISGIILYNFSVFGVAPEIFILTATVLALGGLYLADYTGRRRWEKTITREINDIKQNQDQVIRDVGRSRTDIKGLKSGLRHAVESVREEGKRFSAPDTVEARMLDVLVSKLGELGHRPRSLFRTVSSGDRTVSLKSTPPKASTPPPRSELDKAITPDFDRYSDALLKKIVNRALEEDRMALFMQPVVSLPQRTTKMFEIFTRIQSASGSWLPAARYMDFIRKDNRTNSLDNQILMRSLSILKVSHNTAPDIPCILNITAETLRNRKFMAGLVEFIAKNRTMASRIIFELPYEELDRLRPNNESLMEALVKLGCRFSVDQVYQRRLSPERLARYGVRFMKFDADWLMREYKMPNGYSRLSRLKTELDAAGIDIVIEKIEAEDTLRHLLDIDPGYGQGYLFGKPDLPVAWSQMRAA